MYTYKLLIIILMGPCIYLEFSKKILSYYFIDLYQILNRPKLGPVNFINFIEIISLSSIEVLLY